MSSKRETIQTAGGLRVEGASAKLLKDLLDEFENTLMALGANVSDVLAPGLGREQVVNALESVGLVAPEEMIVWFGWHNGMRLDEHGKYMGEIPFITPERIEWLVGRYQYDVENLVPLGLWERGWLPLESDDALAVFCAEDPTQTPLVRREAAEEYDFLTEYRDYQLVSMSTVVSWWIEALSVGAVWQREDGRGWDRDPAKLLAIDQGTLILT